MNTWFSKWIAAVLALAALLVSASAIGQAWPQRPVRVVVSFAAGGNNDVLARIVSERLSAVMGQNFFVENRIGGNGAVAAEFVARSPADGYTLFFAGSPLYSLPLAQKVNFDPYTDFAPISIVGTNPFVLGVHISVPATTLKEFVDYVKQRPGQMNYASGGTGTTAHLAPALFLARAGLDMTHIPYKGGSQAVAGLVAGQVHMQMGNASELIQFSKTGKIRMLGISSDKRSPQLPDLPAIAESYPGLVMGTFNGYLAPAATPKPLIDRLSQAIVKIVHEPATIARFNSMGVDATGTTPDEFAEFLRREAAMWRDAVKAAGIKLE